VARDFIKIDKTQAAAIQAQSLISYIATLRSAYDQGVKVLAVMGHLNDGTVFTDLETSFGLPAGKGLTVFNLVTGVMNSMNGTAQIAAAKNLTETVGG
jgi:hypothetical protein